MANDTHGFATMDESKQREIASKGGKASHDNNSKRGGRNNHRNG